MLDSQKRWADALQVVQDLAKHPKLPADRKETLVVAQARYFYRLKRQKEADALLAPLWQNPTRGGASLYDIAVEKARAALDLKDHARARSEIEAGLTRLRELRAATQQLEYISARLYVSEKNYSNAFEAYARCCGGAPSATVVTEVRQLFKLALADKKLSEAQTISNEILKWRIDPIVPALMQAQLAHASADPTAARAAIARARQELKRFWGPQKEAWEKEVTAVEATL